MTQDEIVKAGLDALARDLGTVGMIRFLQQFENGRGDYTVERGRWLDGVDVETLWKQARDSPPVEAGEV